jgi:hypothetical protein
MFWEFPAAALFSFTHGFSGEVNGASVGALMSRVLIHRLIGTMFAAVHHAERRRVGAAKSFRT